MIKRFQSSVSRLALGLLLVVGLAFTSEAKPKRVLLVTVTMGFHHTSTKSAEKIIPELGAKSGKFTVDIVRSGPEPKGAEAVAAWKDKARKDLAEHMSPEALKQYDLILFANTTMDLPIPSMDAFLDFIKSGKGFVGIHSASDTFHSKGDKVSAYVDMLGSEFLTHNAQATVECLNMDPSFPATKHFDSSVTFHDEIYLMKNFHREKVHGLLTLDKHPNTRQPGDYPIAWCKNYGKGRVFYTSLGHREDVWDSPHYQEHVLHGILWALGLEKGDATPQSTKLVLAKSEVKEGFKPLFNGTDTTGWHLRNPDGNKSWSTQNGMLVNTLKPGEHGVDLVTDEKYWNFTVRYEYMIPKGSNSGFYLRGRHEIQIFDDFATGKPSLGGNGAIYQHTAPSKFASGQAGEWQTVEATMIGNKVSITLNGVKIHENVVVERATGSELDKNVDQPGQLFLQGDHGAIAFRNLRIKVLK